jgi:hypothetical protein
LLLLKPCKPLTATSAILDSEADIQAQYMIIYRPLLCKANS